MEHACLTIPVVILTLAVSGCQATGQPATSADEAVVTDQAASATEESEAGPRYVYKGPAIIEDTASVGIGTKVREFTYLDVTSGHGSSLGDLLKGSKGLVVVMSSIGCPVTRAYAPSMEELAQSYAKRGLRILAVNASIQDDADGIRALVERLGWTFPVTQDPTYAIIDALGAQRTADVFLIDPEGRLRYRGAIDDQFGFNYRLPEARNHYLEDALTAMLAGTEVAVAATDAPGCKLSRINLPE